MSNFYHLRRKLRSGSTRVLAIAIFGVAMVGPLQSQPQPTVAPEISGMATLLRERQGVNLGNPMSAETRGSSISHFQLFKEGDNAILNSAEVHDDGCIYIAYTPARGPVWYDTREANDENRVKNNQIPAGSSRVPWHVALSTGRNFDPGAGFWITNFGAPGPGMLTGDFNGDGKTDIVGWNPEARAWHVALSTGRSFDASTGFWITEFGAPEVMLMGDFNGDGKTDIAGWNEPARAWHVALSTGRNFDPGAGFWITEFGGPGPGMLTGDFNGDGKTDIAGWNPEAAAWHVALSTGHSFDPGAGFWTRGFGGPGIMLLGDFNGDRKTDIAGWNDDRVTFSELKATNVDEANWRRPAEAFPSGRGPAPRWFKMCVPPGAAPDSWTSSQKRQVRARTPPLLPSSGAHCFWDAYHDRNGSRPLVRIGGPGEWQTILPLDTNGNNGQKKYHPNHGLGAVVEGTTNHYVTWDELIDLAQTDPNRVMNILRWNGHPNSDDLGDRRIPWMSSQVEGIVPNSFLSGEDYAGNHRPSPRGWWLGDPPPKTEFSRVAGVFPNDNDCGTLESISNALCDDWIVYVKPDPEYTFMLAAIQTRPVVKFPGTSRNGWGNFDDEHKGSLENEVEQWMIPGGYRSEPGDRIRMTGRWTVDCGHDDWHAELHPIESYVSSHSEAKSDSAGGLAVVASLVVTADWPGDTLDFDIWPPARPSAAASLKWFREPCCHDTGGKGIGLNVSVQETLEPRDNPNHIHVKIVSRTPPGPLLTKELNDVYPDMRTIRTLATRYRLWWDAPRETGPGGRQIR